MPAVHELSCAAVLPCTAGVRCSHQEKNCHFGLVLLPALLRLLKNVLLHWVGCSLVLNLQYLEYITSFFYWKELWFVHGFRLLSEGLFNCKLKIKDVFILTGRKKQKLAKERAGLSKVILSSVMQCYFERCFIYIVCKIYLRICFDSRITNTPANVQSLGFFNAQK